MTQYTFIGAALVSAFLFGATTPLAKQLLGELSPSMLAGLLYLGSGCGLIAARLIRDRAWRRVTLNRNEYFSLAGSIAVGGIMAPILLLIGLTRTSAADASLLLNLEGVLTAVVAWSVFKENAGKRVVVGMACIVAGGVLLAWNGERLGDFSGAGLIAAACMCWAIDNNLTRAVSNIDALFVSGAKGLCAGIVNVSIALAFGAALPGARISGAAMVVGLFGYGISLVLFVVALRGLGAARTSAYFSTAPFVGAAVSIGLGEPASAIVWIAGGLMAIGVWLHITESHAHLHAHEAMDHDHMHVHDEHHRHDHDFPWDGTEPHSHPHRHEPLVHSHAHFPDIHHRHAH